MLYQKKLRVKHKDKDSINLAVSYKRIEQTGQIMIEFEWHRIKVVDCAIF